MARRYRQAKGPPTVAALGRVEPHPAQDGRYRDPRTRQVYSRAQVERTVRAVGLRDAATRAALIAKGYGRDWRTQWARVQSFTGTLAGKGPQGAPATVARKQVARAVQARDTLTDLVASYRGRQTQRGRSISAAQALAPGSALWTHLRTLNRAKRETVRAGKAVGVGPDSQAARALVALGLRPEWAEWRVGESPKADLVAKLLARPDGAPPPWAVLTDAERARVNAALEEGGELQGKYRRRRTAEEAVLKIIGPRSAANPRRKER